MKMSAVIRPGATEDGIKLPSNFVFDSLWSLRQYSLMTVYC